MDPTLAAIVTVLAVLAASGVVARARRTVARYGERYRDMALERGLSSGEIRQLETLAKCVNETSLADLLISPIRFSRCVGRYLARLRATPATTDSRYYQLVLELTALRRKLHPPGKRLRFLYSSRELPDGDELVVRADATGPPRRAVIWAVNEDHFEIRLLDVLSTRGFRKGAVAHVEMNRQGQGRYRFEAEIRKVEDEPRPVLRLEHTSEIRVDNRREHLREESRTTIFVRCGDDREPLQAKLVDVSGGGLSFAAERPVTVDTIVDVTCALGDSDLPPIRARAAVLRREDLGNGQWQHVGSWLDLPDETREHIIRHVFDLHRSRIKEAKTA